MFVLAITAQSSIQAKLASGFSSSSYRLLLAGSIEKGVTLFRQHSPRYVLVELPNGADSASLRRKFSPWLSRVTVIVVHNQSQWCRVLELMLQWEREHPREPDWW